MTCCKSLRAREAVFRGVAAEEVRGVERGHDGDAAPLPVAAEAGHGRGGFRDAFRRGEAESHDDLRPDDFDLLVQVGEANFSASSGTGCRLSGGGT